MRSSWAGAGLDPARGPREEELAGVDGPGVLVAVHAPGAAAVGEQRAVREDGRVHVAALADVGRPASDRAVGHVHEQRRVGLVRVVVVVVLGVGAADHQDLRGAVRARGEHDRRPPLAPAALRPVARQDLRRGDGPCDRVDEAAVLLVGAHDDQLALGVEEHVRVEPEALVLPEELDRAHPVEVRRGREDLDVEVVVVADVEGLLIEAGGDDHPAVAQLGEGRVPAPVAHPRLLDPGLVEGVEGEDHVVALVLGIALRVVLEVAAGHEDAAVAQHGLAGAPEVVGQVRARVVRRVAAHAGVCGRVEHVGLGPVGRRVDGGLVRRAPGVARDEVGLLRVGEPEDLARRQQDRVDRQAVDLDEVRVPLPGDVDLHRLLQRPVGLGDRDRRAEQAVLPAVRRPGAARALPRLRARQLRAEGRALRREGGPVAQHRAARGAELVAAQVLGGEVREPVVDEAPGLEDAGAPGGVVVVPRHHRREPERRGSGHGGGQGDEHRQAAAAS